MWDFYLGWCEGAFRGRTINVAQVLVAKNGAQDAIWGDPMAPNREASRAAARCTSGVTECE